MGLEELLLVDMSYGLNIIKILANEHRLLILCYLNGKERSVNELSLLLKMPQPSISQHLALMRQNGLVETKHQKQRVYYSLSDQTTKDIINILHKSCCKSS